MLTVGHRSIGPEPIQVGFIGAPIATSVSYNLISVASVGDGIFYVEETAWHPLSGHASPRRTFRRKVALSW